MADCFAVAAPGLAPYVAQELRTPGLLAATASLRVEAGGVSFAASLGAIYRANLHLRTANRVLVRLGEFRAVGFAELRKRAGRLPWERYLTPGRPIALRVTCHKSKLYHSDAVAERVAAAIGDRFGVLPPVEKFDEESEEQPPQLVFVRLLHDICTVSVDSSGSLLHRRGYRLATARAPMRETLAAGMLLASGWDPLTGAPLLDPFCGSGTIAIEAAMQALGVAPGRGRHFAFMDWPGYEAALWDEQVAAADRVAEMRRVAGAALAPIQASDRDEGAIAAARANAERAGVGAAIEFASLPISAIAPPPGPGWVVTNPPYGVRVAATRDLRNLYAQLGKVLRVRCPGWHVALLCNDQGLLGQMKLALDTSLHMVNGGIPVMLARGVVEAAQA